MYFTLRNIGLVLIILSLFAVIIACGKGKKVSTGTSFSLASSNNPVTIIQGSGESEGGLRQTVEFDYDLEEYPAEDGFTVVPMETDRRASSIQKDRISLSVKGTEENKSVELNVNGIENPTLHFRYDPDKWEVTGVSSTGLYGDDKYLFMAAIAKSGILVVHAEPAGKNVNTPASGEIAEVQLAPKGTMRRTSEVADDPPGSVDSLTVAWFVYPPFEEFPEMLIHFDNTITYRMDGSAGIYVSKDGALDSTERNNIEPVYDNVVHDAKYDSTNMTLTWKERLQGDYNNDGEVTVADLTPLAWLYGEGEGSPISYCQGAAVDSLGAFYNIPAMYGEQWNDEWLHAPQPLYSFYYNDEYGWTDPSGFVADHSSYEDGYGLTDRDTALDGFMDGYVYPYQNLSEGYDELPNGFWTSPETEVYQPGDIAPIEAHYLEKIDGYRVLTVPTGKDEGDWRTADPDDYTDGIMVLATYDREREKAMDYMSPYDEQPWANPDYTGLRLEERLRKAEFEIRLTATSFETGFFTGTFDIVIEPYIFDDPKSRTYTSDMQFGPITRIQNVYTYGADPGIMDGYGPKYFDGTPPDPDAASTGGIVSAEQSDQDTLTIEYKDADDVKLDEYDNEIRDLDHEVKYYLYGCKIDPENPPQDPSVVFAAGNNLAVWSEEPSEDVDSLNRSYSVGSTAAPLKGDLLGNPGDVIWLGVRASCYYLEYVPPLGGENVNYYQLTVEDQTPPHFIVPDDFYSESRRDNAISFASQVFRYTNGLRIFHNPAIDPPEYLDSTVITYRLYFSDVESDLEDLSDDTPIDSHLFSFLDREEEVDGLMKTKLKFDVYADDLDLEPGITYYYRITAEDEDGNVSEDERIEKTELRNFDDESIDLPQDYTDCANAEIPGDMLVHDGDVYLLYPAVTPGPLKMLTFQKVLTGNRDPQYWLPCDIIPNSGTMPRTIAQMSVQLNPQGEPITDSNGVLCPMVSFTGTLGVEYPKIQYRREVNNNIEWVLESPVEANTEFWSHYNGSGIGTMKVVDGQQSEIKQFLGWVYDELPLDSSAGSLIYTHRTDELDQNGKYLSWPATIPIEVSAAEYFRVPGSCKGNDIIVRTAHGTGATTEPVPGQGGGQTYHDRMYMLVSGARCGDYGNSPWLVSKLFWTDDPSVWSTANCVDLKEELEFLGAPEGTSFGPNALDVVEQLDSPGERNVYVVYNGAGGDPFSSNLGLKTEMARDTSDGPSSFFRAGSFNMIDDTYYYPFVVEDRLSFSQVDLRHKQTALYAEGMSPYTGLGCVYVHPDGNVYLAETSETGWEPRALTPGPSGAIDQGEILWAKLIYNYEDEEDVPYILYVVKTELEGENEDPIYHLKLWTPDD